ncbi:dehydrogenase/reductase SDR family member 11-like isoform X2 [Periplaneta americana]|uniref:dehydrogenase/reductase SDR family member 11-like isoform X2 n=1 Tax=Periplaneta americana TaxID=6978 RepID=UPI0037E7E0AF
MHRWAGRVAVVTGASSAIGAAITQQLVTNAVNVVGMARRVEKVQDLASILKSEPGKLYPIKCDITKDQELKDTFSWVKDTLGGVDLLINNAGTNKPHSLTDGPDEVFKRIVDVNILALARCTRLAIQSMRERGVDDGHILHINSIVGHFIHPGVLMYSASKHAVTVMTEGLRRELWKEKSRIRVTSLSPGLACTHLPYEEAIGEYSSLEPADIAKAAIYALSAPPHVQIHELMVRPVPGTS